MLDILEIDLTDHVPEGAQIENWRIKSGPMMKQGNITATPQNLQHFISSPRPGGLFGNHGKAVPDGDINKVGHSLLFVQVSRPKLHTAPRKGKNQLRMSFEYQRFTYDLPVTDPAFDEAYHQNTQIFAGIDTVFLTLSLGLVQNDWHSKLIAGVVRC